MRWGESETYQFVKLYLEHELLWNPHLPTHKFRQMRLKAIRSIITNLKLITGILMNEEEVRIKIKNLRSTYAQELAKIKQRSVAEYTYKSTIKWFPEWHQCYQTIKTPKVPGRTDVTHCEKEDNEDPSEKIWIPGVGTTNVSEDTDTDPFVSQADDTHNMLDVLKSEQNEFQCKRGNSHYNSNKRQKIKHRSPSSDHSDGTFRGSMDSGTDIVTKDDEFDIYGKYIASQLRQMDFHRALRLQLEIQGLVSEARISELANK